MDNWGYNPTSQFHIFCFRQEIQQYNKQLFEIFQQFAWAVAVTRPPEKSCNDSYPWPPQQKEWFATENRPGPQKERRFFHVFFSGANC